MSTVEREAMTEAADLLRRSVELSASQPQTNAAVTGVWLNARYHPVIPTPAALALADWLDNCAAEIYCSGPAEFRSASAFARGMTAPTADPAAAATRAELTTAEQEDEA